MSPSHLIPNVFSAMLQLLLGLLANGTIVVVNGMDLAKRRKLAPLDLLLSCLAISRLCMQSFIFYIHLGVLSLIEVNAVAEGFIMFLFINFSGTWFATWLGVFYCMKIANFAHPLFFWLKMRISRVVPWLVLGTLLYASITSVFHGKYTWRICKGIWLSLFATNATYQIQEAPVLYFVLLGVELFLPFFIFLLFALLLILSLMKHSRQVRNTVRGSRACRTYLRALLSIFSFVVLYFSHCIAATLLSAKIFTFRGFLFYFGIFVIGSYPSGHSIVLILGNYKLKQNAKKFLLHSKCLMKRNIDPGKEYVGQ